MLGKSLDDVQDDNDNDGVKGKKRNSKRLLLLPFSSIWIRSASSQNVSSRCILFCLLLSFFRLRSAHVQSMPNHLPQPTTVFVLISLCYYFWLLASEYKHNVKKLIEKRLCKETE